MKYKYNNDYNTCKNKYTELSKIIKQFKHLPIYTESEWEIPKGKKHKNELFHITAKRELEERSSTRTPESTPGKPTRKLTSLTRNSSPNISRRRKLPRKPLSQLQSQKLPQLKSQSRPKLLQSKPLQPRKRRKKIQLVL